MGSEVEEVVPLGRLQIVELLVSFSFLCTVFEPGLVVGFRGTETVKAGLAGRAVVALSCGLGFLCPGNQLFEGASWQGV